MSLTVKHSTLTGAPADPGALVDGVAWDADHTVTGNLPVSQLDSGTNASSSTYWRGDGTWAAASPTPAALTRVNDTNVTATLGGAPTTALLAATSITLGWTGTLAASRGGFGSDVSAAAGVPLFAAGVPTFTSTTGSGNFVRATSPTLVTPALGTPSSGVLTNCTAFTLTTTGTSGAATYSAGTLNIPQYAATTLPTRFWTGYTHSNNGVSPNTKIDVAAGSCRDSTDAINIVNSSGTIDCGTTGANALDAGSLANTTWYYTFAITTAGGTTAFLASLSATSPTLPGSYTKFRRIGAFLTDGSAHIVAFTHVNNTWTWTTSPRDYNAIPTLATLTPAVISVPRIQGVVAKMGVTAFTSPAVTTGSTCYVYPGFIAATAKAGFTVGTFANTWGIAQNTECQVDSSGRVNVHTASAGTDPIKVVIDTAGWRDDL